MTSDDAARLLREHGPNALPEPAPLALWRRFLRQFKSPLIYILLFAVAFDVAVWIYEHGKGWPVEGFVIAVVLLLNAGLGTFQEHRSEQALTQLKVLTSSTVWVTRDEKLVEIASRDIVPGDAVRIEAGERVPADGMLIEGVGVMADEAVLTGESVPVEKVIDGDELHSGTLVVRGKGVFRVSRTGQHSSMGKIATMLSEVVTEKTPLERRLAVLGNQIALGIGGLTVLLIVLGTVTEGIGRLDEVVMFAVALAVAGIPEGMPAVVTLTLALGVKRMAARNALVRRLSAVEALGSVTVIATDKTGTLTEERMVVHELDAHSDDKQHVNEQAALLAMALANDADAVETAGDPLEIGLIAYARSRGMDVAHERTTQARVHTTPFDSAWKYMRVTVESNGGNSTTSYLKGAPEVLIDRSTNLTTELRADWMARAENAAERGYKVLALATGGCGDDGGDGGGGGRGGNDEEEKREIANLTFLGLVMLWDPPRPEVAASIKIAHNAGVRIMMITGDHPGTARAVATAIGLPTPTVLTGDEIDAFSSSALREAVRVTNVFARVSPTHKLKLVEALKANGEIVAMTGDGVNDAPALKRADVGIAMGKRGSDVAREVADLVLLDDNFATIVGAIEEGRGIHENIQSFIRFTFSTNVALMVLVVTGAVGAYLQDYRDAMGMLVLPLTALQLLWINFLGDGPPALALALDRTPGQMDRPPRPPKSGLLDRASALFILATGAFKGVLGITLLIAMPAFGYGLVVTQTLIFLYESVGKLVSVYPSRQNVEATKGRKANWVLHTSILVGVGLQVLTLFIPPLRRFLGLAMLDAGSIGILVVAVVATWAAAALTSRVIGHTKKRPDPNPDGGGALAWPTST